MREETRIRERARLKAYREANRPYIREQQRLWRLAHLEDARAMARRYYQKNKERIRREQRLNSDRARVNDIRRKYRLSPELVARLLRIQHNACAICRQPFDAKRVAHFDHLHGGDVRGALCGPCNKGLGWFRDNPQFLRAAAQYVVDPPAGDLLTPQLALFEESA